MSIKLFGIKFYVSPSEKDEILTAFSNVGIRFTENQDSVTLDKEETEASNVATLGVLNTVNSIKYGPQFTGAVAKLKSKVVKNIDIIKATLINSVSGSISKPMLAANIELLKSVENGLSSQVVEAISRHKEELDRRNAMYDNILNIGDVEVKVTPAKK